VNAAGDLDRHLALDFDADLLAWREDDHVVASTSRPGAARPAPPPAA